jgi:hypothetical protein
VSVPDYEAELGLLLRENFKLRWLVYRMADKAKAPDCYNVPPEFCEREKLCVFAKGHNGPCAPRGPGLPQTLEQFRREEQTFAVFEGASGG